MVQLDYLYQITVDASKFYLGEDARFPLSEAEIKAVLADPAHFLGAAPAQVDAFAKRVAPLRQRFPNAEGYRPEPIL